MRARAYVRTCVRASVRARARACVCVCVQTLFKHMTRCVMIRLTCGFFVLFFVCLINLVLRLSK